MAYRPGDGLAFTGASPVFFGWDAHEDAYGLAAPVFKRAVAHGVRQPEPLLQAIREILVALGPACSSKSDEEAMQSELAELIDVIASIRSGLAKPSLRVVMASGVNPAFADRVETLIWQLHQARDGMPSLQQVADLLHLSPRSLSRRLARENTSWQAIKDRLRRRLAEHLLATTDLPVGRIGERVGYKEPGDFTRAFRHWTGLTPSAYRSGLSQQEHSLTER